MWVSHSVVGSQVPCLDGRGRRMRVSQVSCWGLGVGGYSRSYIPMPYRIPTLSSGIHTWPLIYPPPFPGHTHLPREGTWNQAYSQKVPRARHTHPMEGTWDQAYPPPPCEQTHASDNITFRQLLWQVVIRIFRKIKQASSSGVKVGIAGCKGLKMQVTQVSVISIKIRMKF